MQKHTWPQAKPLTFAEFEQQLRARTPPKVETAQYVAGGGLSQVFVVYPCFEANVGGSVVLKVAIEDGMESQPLLEARNMKTLEYLASQSDLIRDCTVRYYESASCIGASYAGLPKALQQSMQSLHPTKLQRMQKERLYLHAMQPLPSGTVSLFDWMRTFFVQLNVLHDTLNAHQIRKLHEFDRQVAAVWMQFVCLLHAFHRQDPQFVHNDTPNNIMVQPTSTPFTFRYRANGTDTAAPIDVSFSTNLRVYLIDFGQSFFSVDWCGAERVVTPGEMEYFSKPCLSVLGIGTASGQSFDLFNLTYHMVHFLDGWREYMPLTFTAIDTVWQLSETTSYMPSDDDPSKYTWQYHPEPYVFNGRLSRFVDAALMPLEEQLVSMGLNSDAVDTTLGEFTHAFMSEDGARCIAIAEQYGEHKLAAKVKSHFLSLQSGQFGAVINKFAVKLESKNVRTPAQLLNYFVIMTLVNNLNTPGL